MTNSQLKISAPARLIFALALVALIFSNLHLYPAVASPVLAASVASTPPDTRVLSDVKLRDNTVMQSFAYNRYDNTWYILQVMQDGRFGKSSIQHSKVGDLTLTKVSSSGKLLGYMYLLGFGHGLSVGVEQVGSKTYIWSEAKSKYMSALSSANANGYGTMIGRFVWKNGTTLKSSSSSVTRYGVNGGKPEQSPFINVAANRIAVHYYSSAYDNFRWAIYPLDQFKKRNYTALKRVTWPSELATITNQGWAYVNDTTFVNLNGNGISSKYPAPGNSTIFTVKVSGSSTLLSRFHATNGASLTPREPEGLTVVNGILCMGLTSRLAGSKTENRANVFCQEAVLPPT